MKLAIISDPERYEKFAPADARAYWESASFFPLDAAPREIAAACPDAEVLLVDAIAQVPAELIEALPRLKVIHSEGVAYNGIDCAAAARAGVLVCNNKGGNAGAVAEQVIMLMLGLLRTVVPGHLAVLAGEQIARKEHLILKGITDLQDCTVGLLGFGDIAQATAARLTPFGCKVAYWSRHRHDEAAGRLGVEYRALDDLLAQADIVSLHMAVTDQTIGFIGSERLAAMRPGAALINTARGELIDNEALVAALADGHLGAAAFDTIAPEPVSADNPVVAYAKDHPEQVLLAPHIGGVTIGSFKRMQAHMWENVRRVAAGERPDCIVNGR